MRTVAMLALLASVAVAFADSSIVVLALPDLLKQFDVSITSVAWVVTAYNVALAVVAFVLARVASRSLDAARSTRIGGLVFLVASLACAISPGIWTLVAFRSAQGAGAALLLVGALPLVRVLAATPSRGTALWAGAGIFGAALGPASGGLLTDIFSWRAIFFAQAPIAALGLAAVLRIRAARPDRMFQSAAAGTSRKRLIAGLALSLASAAPVGLLFLAVVQLIDVWRLSPLSAAGVVSVIPLATLVAQPLSAVTKSGATTAGGVLLAGGLSGMAFLPARNVVWVVVALSISGLGLGLLLPRLTRAVLSKYGSPMESAAHTIWMRHAGLVAGLLILTPLLASDLSAAGNSAKLRGISVVLDAPVAASTKLRLALDLAPALSRPARKGLPDFTKALDPEHDRSLRPMGRELDQVVQATVTRGFRRSFLIAALFGLLAVAPLAFVRRPNLFPRRSLRAPSVAFLAVAALIGAEMASGAAAFGARPRLLPPCAHRLAPETSGADAQAQQLVLAGLDLIACRLHKSREQLIADLARSGVEGAHILAQIERYSRVASHLPDWSRGFIEGSRS